MIYGSICSGIEAATVAWKPLGWKAAFFSEIEKFPRAVLKHHYDTPLHGDFTTIKEDDYDSIDLLVGGTPCQSFSIAGLRKGMADNRGNLALEYLRLAQRLRPRWLVWENVPGVRSSWTDEETFAPSEGSREFLQAEGFKPDDFEEVEQTHDLDCFLAGLQELGYGFAMRSFDAQYFNLAQRRERVFVIGYLGDWRLAAAVLFERHGLSWDTSPSREKGQGVAPTVTGAPPFSRTGNERVEAEAMVMAHGQGNAEICREGSPSLTCNHEAPILIDRAAFNQGENAQYDPHIEETETMDSLVARGPHAVAIRTANTSAHGHGVAKDVAHTLDRAQGQAVVFDTTQITNKDNRCNPKKGDPCHPLAAGAHPPMVVHDQNLMTNMTVRRLTPRECERLQGFPDDYTRIPWNRKKAELCPDGPRYKALGNSMAVPVMRWIGERIEKVEKIIQ